jgi:cytidine deaminase
LKINIKMANQVLQINYQSFYNTEDLQSADATLLIAARKAVLDAYNPYSKFYVGCAILMNNEKIITGFNIENAAYSVCICAERTALGAAITQYPQAKILGMAISTYQHQQPNNTPAFPCGVCRQFISECEDRNIEKFPIIVGGQSGVIHIFESIKDLLPFSFGMKDLSIKM